VRLILEYGAVCWDPFREWQVSALNRGQRRVAKFANHTNESGWETLAQRRMIARLCNLYKAYTGRPALKVIGDGLLKPCYLSRDDHGRKIRSRKQRTDVGKYSFVNRAIKDWNLLPAGVLASFSCKLNTFRKKVREAVTSKEALGGGLNGNK
jgi:MoaA/NifB/PqqE/SkfB family radical SAM enzyme